jgi:diguanylate cyclase (GGDEF)-like protein/PAS domain S-box-containing protein
MTLQSEEHERLRLFKSIFDNISDAIYVIDPQTSNIVDVNQAGCDDLGMTANEVLDNSVLSLQKDVIDFSHWQQILTTIREADTYIFLGRHVRKDGTEFPVEVHTTFFTHNKNDYLISIARDITKRVQLQNELKTREPQLRFALNSASDGLWDWNLANDEVFFSPKMKRMLGYGPDDMAPQLDTWVNAVHPDDLPQVREALDAHLQGKNTGYNAQYRIRNHNGQYLWVQDHGTVCERNAEGEPMRVVGMLRNINESKILENKLRTLAAYDDLTNLLNRRAGYEQFTQLLAFAQRHHHPLSIALLDIDHFKLINDNYGHLTGDDVLKSSAMFIASQLRKSDVLLRWGGEEFLLLMPNTRGEDAYLICDRLREKLAESSPKLNSIGRQITISGGIATFPQQGNTIEELVKYADTAMYKAKEKGRNQITKQT